MTVATSILAVLLLGTSAALATILGVVALLIILLLILRSILSTVGLAWLESGRARLERRSTWLESSKVARAESTWSALLLAHVQLLLSLTGQVLVLGRGIILPRVEVGHVCVEGMW